MSTTVARPASAVPGIAALLLAALLLAACAAPDRPRATPAVTGRPTPGAVGVVGDPGRVTIAVVGDFGTADANEARVADLVAAWAPEHVVALGDLYYAPAGGDATTWYDRTIGGPWCPWLAGVTPGPRCDGSRSATNRFWPATGNHDYSDASIGAYTDYFALPGNERTYDVLLGPVHLFVLDSQAALDSGAEMKAQRAWLERTMAASTAPWQVVAFHHPPRSSGVHGSTAALQWPFADWGADLVLAGHDHDYERIEADGITYVVDGLGGAERRGFGAPVPGSVARYAADWGALELEATATAIVGTFESGADGGTVVDTFRIEAGS